MEVCIGRHHHPQHVHYQRRSGEVRTEAADLPRMSLSFHILERGVFLMPPSVCAMMYTALAHRPDVLLQTRIRGHQR